MKVNGRPMRPIFVEDDAVRIIDQRKLPFALEIATLTSEKAAAEAIKDMAVRGAPLIGATAAYGLALAMREDPGDANLAAARARLLATRPTAINLAWALNRAGGLLTQTPVADRADRAWAEAAAIVEEDVAINRAIGEAGLGLVRAAADKTGGRVDILTHCNAGWLATCRLGHRDRAHLSGA